MSREEEDIIVSIGKFGPTKEEMESHPAFGQISINRVNGGKTILYGSDLIHHNYISLTIYKSHKYRGLSQSWYDFDKNPIAEIKLSESQWATLLSSMNIAGGVPCTLSYLNGEEIPAIAKNRDVKFIIENEADGTINSIIEKVQKISDDVENSTLTKKLKTQILSNLSSLKNSIKDPLKFTRSQFDRYMENILEEAKGEIHGYHANIQQQTKHVAIESKSTNPVELIGEDDECRS